MRTALLASTIGAIAIGGALAVSGPDPTTPARYGSTNVDVDVRGPVHDRAQGTVGLAMRGGDTIFASGVLIAKNLVLTCRHCTHVHSASQRRHAPESLAVRFELASGPADVYPVVGYAYTSERHDLCVLRIGRNAEGHWPATRRVQVLSPRRAPLGTPLYVVHHPRGGALQVAKGAAVLFPYEATPDELARMEARLVAEGGDDSRALEALRTSYRPGPGGRRLNFSTRWAYQPTIGADCATFDGSSGAPVYDEGTHALIGIVFAGGDPTRRGRRTSWENHEAILPAVVIGKELEGAGIRLE